MRAIGSGHTDVGKKRTNNEDAFHVDDARGLYLVSDGMGGHAAGEIASRTAIASVIRRVEAAGDLEGLDGPALDALLRPAVEEASAELYEQATSNPGLAGMGCTMTGLLIGGDRAALAHVGDTRAYLVRQGEAHLLTADHTIAAELCRAGLVEPDRVKSHPHSHALTRAIGIQSSVVADHLFLELRPDDRFVLTTDGVHGSFEDDPIQLVEEVERADPEGVADALVREAVDRDGRDNATAVVIRIASDLPASDATDIAGLVRAVGASFLGQGLSFAQRTRLLRIATVDSGEPGRVVVGPEETIGRLILVVDGALEIDGPDGRRTLDPGEVWGASTLLVPRAAGATVRVAREARWLIIEGSDLHRLARARPWLGVELLERLVRHMSP